MSRSLTDWLHATVRDGQHRAGVLDRLVRSMSHDAYERAGSRVVIYVDADALHAAVHLAATPRPPLPDVRPTDDEARRLLDAAGGPNR